MPSGYTDIIEKGCTFEEFVRRCAKGMYTDRAVSSYHVDALVEAQESYKLIEAMALGDCAVRARQEFEAAVHKQNEWQESLKILREKHLAMLAQVRAWTPPTPDHEEFKHFMVQQLTEALRVDCQLGPNGEELWQPYVFLLLSASEWREKKLVQYMEDRDYYTRKIEEEKKHVAFADAWHKALDESLKSKPPTEPDLIIAALKAADHLIHGRFWDRLPEHEREKWAGLREQAEELVRAALAKVQP